MEYVCFVSVVVDFNPLELAPIVIILDTTPELAISVVLYTKNLQFYTLPELAIINYGTYVHVHMYREQITYRTLQCTVERNRKKKEESHTV